MFPDLDLSAFSVRRHRFPAIDWLRGFLILLMIFDHTAMYCLNGWYFRESALTGRGIPELPVMYIIRGLSHFGAPCFVIIAGFCLAVSEMKRLSHQGDTHGVTTKLITRGLLLVAIDRLVLSALVIKMPMFDIVTTIGLCMVLMALVRKIYWGWVAGGAMLWMVVNEALVLHLVDSVGRVGAAAVFLTGGKVSIAGTENYFNYPVLMWLPYMALGWSFGSYVMTRDERQRSGSVVAGWTGVAALTLFILLRMLGQYGNMNLQGSFTDMTGLYLSKYPPSLTFSLYAIGVSGLLLAALMAYDARRERVLDTRWVPFDLLGVLGRTPLFAYIMHFVLLAVLTKYVELKGSSMLTTWGVVLGIAVVLSGPCMLYFDLKQRWSVLRYF